jgi:hypothetical protein
MTKESEWGPYKDCQMVADLAWRDDQRHHVGPLYRRKIAGVPFTRLRQ